MFENRPIPTSRRPGRVLFISGAMPTFLVSMFSGLGHAHEDVGIGTSAGIPYRQARRFKGARVTA